MLILNNLILLTKIILMRKFACVITLIRAQKSGPVLMEFEMEVAVHVKFRNRLLIMTG